MTPYSLLPRRKMDSNTLNDLCSLCFDFKIESSQNKEVTEKVEKYLQIKMNYSSTGICLHCYNSIEGFHEFYERVHAAQKNLQEKHSKLSQQTIPQAQSKDSEIILKTDEEQSELINVPSDKEGITSVSLERTFEEESVVEDEELREKTENKMVVLSDEGFNSETSDTKVTKTKGTINKGLKHSKFKEVSSEIEKKMLEFYNIKCEKCEDATFTSFKMLNKHYMNVHNTQGYIKCCKRNIRVNDTYYLKSHMFKHLQPDTCRCRVCGKELSSSATLKHHMILHKPTEERPFQCSKCDKRFCCKNDLKNHEKAIHLPESEREDYICDVCGKIFQKVANLRYHHSTVHLQERRYICESCAKCFTTQSGLRIHINAAHSKLSPIQCQACNKWLKTKDTFQKHLQLHQNNSYPCTYCKKVCNSSASLRSHLVKHSEERPYTCTVCRKSFKTKTHLKNHSTQHLAGNHYKCPYCSKLFVNMSNYYTHRRRMHSKERDETNNKQENKILAEGNIYQSQQYLDTDQGSNNDVYDYKLPKNDLENCNEIPADISSVRQNVVVAAADIKYL